MSKPQRNSIKDQTPAPTALWISHLSTLPGVVQLWLKEQSASLEELAQHLIRIHRHREMWSDFSAAVEARDPRCGWTRHYDALYVDSQVLAITRVFHAKQPNSFSLSQIIDGIRQWPQLLVGLDDFQVSEGFGLKLKPIQDKQALRTAVNKLEPWRNQVIGHISRRPRPPQFSWPDLDDAIDLLTSTFKLYAYRVTGVHFIVDPSISTGWHSAFSEGFYKPDGI